MLAFDLKAEEKFDPKHHVEKILFVDLERRQFVCLADASVDEQRVELASSRSRSALTDATSAISTCSICNASA